MHVLGGICQGILKLPDSIEVPDKDYNTFAAATKVCLIYRLSRTLSTLYYEVWPNHISIVSSCP